MNFLLICGISHENFSVKDLMQYKSCSLILSSLNTDIENLFSSERIHLANMKDFPSKFYLFFVHIHHLNALSHTHAHIPFQKYCSNFMVHTQVFTDLAEAA